MATLIESVGALVRDEPVRALIALPGLGRTITAADLWRLYHVYLKSLSTLDIGSGQLLVCGTGNRPDLLPILLACRSLDITLLAADSGATEAELRTLCTTFGAEFLLVPASATYSPTEHLEVSGGLVAVRCPNDSARYSGTAILKLTSGSSGVPRAARTTEAQLVADGTQIIQAMAIGRDDTQLAAIPLAHSYGLGVLVMPLFLQGTGIVLRESFVPHQLPNDARQFGARRMPGVPFMFEYLVEHLPAAEWPPSLRTVVSAGAPLSPSTVRAFYDRFGVKVHSFYGTSETGGISYDASDAREDAHTLGHPLPGVSITVRAAEGLPDGAGQVHVRSPAVSDGYVGDATDAFTEGGFLTSDYGRIETDGRLTLLGRVSSFINVAGRKVHPGEVEAILGQMPGILEVRVVGVADAKRGHHVVACLVAKPGWPVPGLADIRRFCSSKLAAHKIPRTTFFVDAIPVTSRGKTDRARLEDLARQHMAQVLPGGMV